MLLVLIYLEIQILSLIARIHNKLVYLFNKNDLKKGEGSVKYKKILSLYDDVDFLLYVKEKKDGFLQNLSNIKTLVISDSTADYGFHPQYYNDSFNLGLISFDLYSSYQLYMSYRDELSSLNEIICFLNVSSIGFSLIHTSEKYRTVAYKYFFNIEYFDETQIKKRYEKWIISICKKLHNEKIDDGYRGYKEKYYFGTHIKTSQRAKTHLRENIREPDQLQWLVKLAHFVGMDNRKLVLVIPPCREDYMENLPMKSVLYEKIHKLDLKNVKLVDFYGDTLFNDNDFGDTDHLNETGAIKLTKKMAQILEPTIMK